MWTARPDIRFCLWIVGNFGRLYVEGVLGPAFFFLDGTDSTRLFGEVDWSCAVMPIVPVSGFQLLSAIGCSVVGPKPVGGSFHQ